MLGSSNQGRGQVFKQRSPGRSDLDLGRLSRDQAAWEARGICHPAVGSSLLPGLQPGAGSGMACSFRGAKSTRRLGPRYLFTEENGEGITANALDRSYGGEPCDSGGSAKIGGFPLESHRHLLSPPAVPHLLHPCSVGDKLCTGPASAACFHADTTQPGQTRR